MSDHSPLPTPHSPLPTMLRLGLTLALYAAAACVGLAFVYAGTETIIAERTAADQDAALRELFPDGENFDDVTGDIASLDAAVSFDSEFAVRRDGRLIGVVISARTASYGGNATVLVGTAADGTVAGVKILSLSDTPGLGLNAASSTYFVNKAERITFYGQFAGKAASDPFQPKDDVVAITAATITSRAISLAVKTAAQAASAWLSTQGQW